MADNILDDVDEILDAEILEDEKSFNESELQDIMSEIEDLEKEFDVIDESPMSLQEKIDAELAAELEDIAHAEIITDEEVEAMDGMEDLAAPAPKAAVLSFAKPAVKSNARASDKKSQVAFAAQGQMSLNLDFMVGSETANLSIDPVKGLIVTLSGVELCINEDSGCTVSMENGTKFTIPLSSQAQSTKKKSA